MLSQLSIGKLVKLSILVAECNVYEGDQTQTSESRIKTNEFIKIERDLKL